MQVRATRTNEVSQQVEVEIDEKVVNAAAARKLREMAAKVRIDGFRPGKAPANIVRQRFGQSARVEAIDDVVNKKMFEALQTEGLNETIQFSQAQVQSGVEGGNLVFTFVAENFPEVTPVDYKGVKVELQRSVLEESAVDAEIKKLQEEFTKLEPVEGRTTVEANDVVRVSYIALGDGPQAEMAQDDQEIDLSRDDLLAGVATGLVGAEKDGKTVVTVTLPEDFPLDELKGSDIQLEIEVHEILGRQAPELNDDFAKETGRADTYDALRSSIENELLEARKKANEGSARQRLLDTIAASNSVTVPPMYLSMQSQQQVMQQLQMFEQQGIDWRNMNLDVNMLLEASERDMEPSLARSLVMQAIASAESIEVTEEEVRAEIDKIAEDRGEPASRVLATMGGEEALDELRFRKLMERVLDFVWSEATITEVDELTPQEEPAAESEEA